LVLYSIVFLMCFVCCVIKVNNEGFIVSFHRKRIEKKKTLLP